MTPLDLRRVLRDSVPDIRGGGRTGEIHVKPGREPLLESFRISVQDSVDRLHRLAEVRK